MAIAESSAARRDDLTTAAESITAVQIRAMATSTPFCSNGQGVRMLSTVAAL